jgi:ATP-dependent DNA helicase RecG
MLLFSPLLALALLFLWILLLLPAQYGDTYLAALQDKTALLHGSSEKKRIVTVGGSGAAFGQWSDLLEKEFPEYGIAMLHGRMKPAEKNKIMEDFADRKIQILVSTTVVEVGVDVPNATVIMIENAERFGLAALHQLRGRVGRGDAQSYAIFMSGQESADIRQRLDILNRSNDGFEIAEKDFELRGPGDLLGIRQSGDALFDVADLQRDRDVLAKAGGIAAVIMHDDPAQISETYSVLRTRLNAYMSKESVNLIL